MTPAASSIHALFIFDLLLRIVRLPGAVHLDPRSPALSREMQ
jgi:hypothetical protein